jgi:twitching motility protein PilT
LAQEALLHAVIVQALTDMDARPAAPHVAALLQSESPDVRFLAVQYLAKMDAADHRDQLSPLHDDPDARVRRAARDLLARWRISIAGGTSTLPLLDRLLLRVAENEGDDLLIAPGRPAYMKRMGKTTPLTDAPLSVAQVEAVLLPALSAEQLLSLQVLQDVDYSHEVKREGLRFRANIFREMGGLAGVFRRIKGDLPDIDTLGLPALVKHFGDLKNGLVLVGGPTGSGKSTTLAAIIDYINRTSARHIMSLEDPIEVVHPRQLSLVNQREIGTHSKSFSRALRSTLRGDPNVILVGEMRDLTTIEFTVTAAETGHLVFGTVHTVSAATSVDRLISAFPPGQQAQVRSMLADSLRAVVCQHLLPEKSGKGRVLALEILLNNGAVANMIRKGKCFQLPSVISTSAEQGMRLMDGDLLRLLKEGRVRVEDAYVKATNKKDFEAFLEGGKG